MFVSPSQADWGRKTGPLPRRCLRVARMLWDTSYTLCRADRNWAPLSSTPVLLASQLGFYPVSSPEHIRFKA